MKRLLVLLSFLTLTSPVFASGFQLKNIGGLDTKGMAYTEWWYSTENPSLSGITSVGDSVSVTIDGTASSATVDASGNWSYNPTTLTAGDHTVSITGGAGSTSFTLHVGSSIPSNVSAPTDSDMPVAGIIDNTIGLWLIGGLLLVTGIFVIPNKINS
jgi:hypothetical protein